MPLCSTIGPDALRLPPVFSVATDEAGSARCGGLEAFPWFGAAGTEDWALKPFTGEFAGVGCRDLCSSSASLSISSGIGVGTGIGMGIGAATERLVAVEGITVAELDTVDESDMLALLPSASDRAIPELAGAILMPPSSGLELSLNRLPTGSLPFLSLPTRSPRPFAYSPPIPTATPTADPSGERLPKGESWLERSRSENDDVRWTDRPRPLDSPPGVGAAARPRVGGDSRPDGGDVARSFEELLPRALGTGTADEDETCAGSTCAEAGENSAGEGVLDLDRDIDIDLDLDLDRD